MTEKTKPLVRGQPRQVPFQEIVTPLSARALFWRPRYLRDAALLHHLPFLFWLVDMMRPVSAVCLGVGNGVGYFALCQAMDRLGAEALCHGLDDRAEDDGGPDRAVQDYNDAHYADFARLERGDPREQVHHFADGSIDLLLLDRDLDTGLIQSLTHDWTRKLSDRAVILFHDTTHRFADTAAQGLLHSLEQACPGVRLEAGAGLAAVLYGPDRLDKLERLAQLSPGAAGHAEVHHVFSRLGAANVHEQTARTEAARAEAALEQAMAADRVLTDMRQLLSAREAALESRTGAEETRAEQLAAAQARLFDLQNAHDARADQIATHAKALAEVEAAAIRQTASRDAALIRERDRAEALAARLSAADATVETVRAEAALQAVGLAEAEATAAAQLAVKDRALALATERLEAAQTAEAEAVRLKEMAQTAAAAPPPTPLPDPAAEVTHADEIRALTTRLETTQQEVLTLQRELRTKADQALRLERLEQDLAAAQQRAADLLASTSWRVTAPLRGVSRLMRRRDRG